MVILIYYSFLLCTTLGNLKETFFENAGNGDKKWLHKTCLRLFKFDPTPTQLEIIQKIAYAKKTRLVISCITRYGKSLSVSAGICLYLLLHRNKRIYVVAPISEQSAILRKYVANYLSQSPIFLQMIGTQETDLDRLLSEFNKNRLFFSSNGMELNFVSAHGEADRLMGHGGDLIIEDESCKIDGETQRTRIMRMLGDSEDSSHIQIGNPWDRNNLMWEHWTSSKYDKIHVNDEVALKEGRITATFLAERKAELTPLEYQVLYKAEFPDEANDALFSYKKVADAEIAQLPAWVKSARTKQMRIVGVDVADEGVDLTVFMIGTKYEHPEAGTFYELSSVYGYSKQDTMTSIQKLMDIVAKEHIDYIHVDSIGMGSTFYRRIEEIIREQRLVVKVQPCHFGSAASEANRFINKKAQMYFRLRNLFEEGMIKIPKHPTIKKELMAMRATRTSGNDKWRIVDPDEVKDGRTTYNGKSPDFADAMVYFIWQAGIPKLY